LIASSLAVLAGMALLIGLGVWQLHRKVWKENLIAAMTARLDQAPQPLPPPAQWTALAQDRDEFRRVRFDAAFAPGEEALVYAPGSALRTDVKGPGYFVFAPAKLSDGRVVVVDRGFVPIDRKDAPRAAPEGVVPVVGVLRWPETRGMFTPADDVAGNVWFLRDPAAMAAARTWGEVAPFYVDQESPAPPGGLPRPGRLVVNLPDNHLQYAITWFGLAAGLAGVYAFWLFGRFRPVR
jgi:surfeit locus 1 family protein